MSDLFRLGLTKRRIPILIYIASINCASILWNYCTWYNLNLNNILQHVQKCPEKGKNVTSIYLQYPKQKLNCRWFQICESKLILNYEPRALAIFLSRDFCFLGLFNSIQCRFLLSGHSPSDFLLTSYLR